MQIRSNVYQMAFSQSCVGFVFSPAPCISLFIPFVPLYALCTLPKTPVMEMYVIFQQPIAF